MSDRNFDEFSSKSSFKENWPIVLFVVWQILFHLLPAWKSQRDQSTILVLRINIHMSLPWTFSRVPRTLPQYVLHGLIFMNGLAQMWHHPCAESHDAPSWTLASVHLQRSATKCDCWWRHSTYLTTKPAESCYSSSTRSSSRSEASYWADEETLLKSHENQLVNF